VLTTASIQVSIRTLRMFLEEQPEVPWDALRYMTVRLISSLSLFLVPTCTGQGEIHYGGRVTDPWDARTTHSVLRTYFTTEVLTEDYAFTRDGRYRVPADGPIADYRDYISALPLEDSPEVRATQYTHSSRC
jgi:dynein heavy chain